MSNTKEKEKRFEVKLNEDVFSIKVPLRDNWLSKLKMFIIGFFV